ncbi:3-oxoacyl-ACP reductase FabG [Luteimonas sp. RD2P54]|uniref:3-oxoacyl-ACP reductase FabG n=1 Tax=Luteimonas endophytica TaxID=3042023 RepID=A0ABT6JCX6_9GAMM|nr:3-oxoacyl-ACP reductase family protein [Luteimonas endophytica]MDH5824686.1 3-oxoacyl-ACP reductase FabG [Luteimonas endophytica]
MTNLAGKVALVTGGSRGIGAAIARRLARDGADVALTYVTSARQAGDVVAAIEAAGRRGLAIAADSADPRAVAEAVERTVAVLGRIDVLVNNAGIFPYQALDEVSLEDFDRTMAIHVRASFVAAQAAARHMHAGGRIINIGSCLAERTGGPNMTVYAASKAALTGLSKGLAQDLGPRGITANVVHPGPVDTDMNPADSELADLQRKALPLGHYGHADDVAATVAHLAGEGGRFITGAAIAVDGGFAA